VFVDQNQISGLVTLVGRGDRIVRLEAVGLRSIKDDLPMQPGTIFRIAAQPSALWRDLPRLAFEE
jgi:hypothetical protein